jgi:hypothetical protein
MTPPVTDLPKQEIPKALECTNKIDVNVHAENERVISPEVPVKKESPEHYPAMEVSAAQKNYVVINCKLVNLIFFS